MMISPISRHRTTKSSTGSMIVMMRVRSFCFVLLLLLSLVWLWELWASIIFPISPSTRGDAIVLPSRHVVSPNTKNNNTSSLIPGLLLPHGDFAYDPSLVLGLPGGYNSATFQAAYHVAVGARRAAAAASAAEIFFGNSTNTTILFLTPHGIQLDDDFGLYLADMASGTMTIGQDLPFNTSSSRRMAYNLTMDHLPLDQTASKDLLKFLQNHNQSIQGIHPYNDVSPMPLNWAEIIPLKLLFEQHQHQGGFDQSNITVTKFMILSMPHRRYKHAADMVPELSKLGETIAEWMTTQNQNQSQHGHQQQNFGVLVSGDLSHTHLQSGPYGYSNTSAPFDEAMGFWAKDPFRREAQDALLAVARHLQPNAMSCGFSGYILWNGMLQYQSRKLGQTQGQVNRRLITSDDADDFKNGPWWSFGNNFFERALSSVGLSRHSMFPQHLSENGASISLGKNGPFASSSADELNATLYVNRNVTYYGMMAALHSWT